LLPFKSAKSLKENKVMAEACGSRTQTSDFQLTANDGVTVSTKLQLESIGVSRKGFIESSRSAIPEAKPLLRLLETGSNTEEIRELISLPLASERRLREFARANPEDAHLLERSLAFRRAALAEFNRILAERDASGCAPGSADLKFGRAAIQEGAVAAP